MLRNPYYRIGVFGPLLAVVGALALFFGLSLSAVVAWLVAINVVTLAVYVYDKLIAGSGRRRVPEAVLWELAALAGSLGAFIGIYIVRHKTRHTQFQLVFWLIVVVQAIVGLGWWLSR